MIAGSTAQASAGPSSHTLYESASRRLTGEMAAAEAEAYLKDHKVAEAISSSLAKIIAERPDQPIVALGDALIELSAAKEKAESPLGDEELRKIEKPIATQERAKWLAKELFGLSVQDGTIKDLDSYDDRNFYFRAVTERKELVEAADGHAAEGGACHYVLKVHNGVESLNPGFIECQNLAMDAVRAKCAGVWCPRALPSVEGWAITYAEQPLANETERRHAIRLLPFKPGQLLGGVIADAPLLADLGAVCAKVTCALATFDHPDAHRTFIWDLAQCLAVRPLLKHLDPSEPERLALVSAVLDEFEATVLPLGKSGALASGIIHGDINDQNVLIGPAQAHAEGEELVGEDGELMPVDKDRLAVAGVIDFGDMCYSWRINEIAICVAYALIALHYDKGGDEAVTKVGDESKVRKGEEMSELEAAMVMSSAYAAEMTKQGNKLSEAEWTVLPTLIACRIAVSLTLGSYSSAQDPTNEYLKLTLLPGLKALRNLRAVPAPELTAKLKAAARA